MDNCHNVYLFQMEKHIAITPYQDTGQELNMYIDFDGTCGKNCNDFPL
jgi:hypothetical protein